MPPRTSLASVLRIEIGNMARPVPKCQIGDTLCLTFTSTPYIIADITYEADGYYYWGWYTYGRYTDRPTGYVEGSSIKYIISSRCVEDGPITYA